MADKLEHAHDVDSIKARISAKAKHNYLRDFVYGAIDGTVTTFAIVSTAAGAGLDANIVVIMGVANLLSDGFSMAASNYLGTKTDSELREKAREMERRHIKLAPEGEREEIRQVFAAKGFTGDDLDRAVEIITANEPLWVDTMLVDELGISLESPSPIKAAMTTFVAFCVVGFLPLAAFVWGFIVNTQSTSMFAISAFATAVAFFFIGAAKSLFVTQKWYRSGTETLLIGGAAALISFVVGIVLKQMERQPNPEVSFDFQTSLCALQLMSC
jgi:vacuolar iron transporter family protein